MSDTQKTQENILSKRAEIKAKKPDFIRTDGTFVVKLGDKWRKPKGRDNKVRRRLRGALPHPSYGSPKAVRGMHPKGLYEKLVSCVKDLEGLDAKKYIVRIGGSVGNKKRRDIVKAAKGLKLEILNPRIMLKEKKTEKVTKTGTKSPESKKASKTDTGKKDTKAAPAKETKATASKVEDKPKAAKTETKEKPKAAPKKAAPAKAKN